MESPIVQDNSTEASWFVNTGNFPFMDHETGVRFEPRTPVRTKLTPWMEGQPTIVAYEFPVDPVDPEAEAKAKADAEAAKALAEANKVTK